MPGITCADAEGAFYVLPNVSGLLSDRIPDSDALAETLVVIQQPTAENGYTAVLRVRDPKPGYGHYTFDVNWR